MGEIVRQGQFGKLIAAWADPLAKKTAWDRLRSLLIKPGFRADDFLDTGPSGNVSIDLSRLSPPARTNEELVRDALRRRMDGR